MTPITIRTIAPAPVKVTAPPSIHSVASTAPRSPGRPGREKDWVAAANNNAMPEFKLASLKDAIHGNAEKGIAANKLLGMMQKNLPIMRSIEEQMQMIAKGIAEGPEAFQAAMMSAAQPTGHKIVSLKEYALTNPGKITLEKDEVGTFLNDMCRSFRVLLGKSDERVIAQSIEDAATDKALAAQGSADDDSADDTDDSADDDSADDDSADDTDDSADDDSAPAGE